jgi:hypothetical protein
MNAIPIFAFFLLFLLASCSKVSDELKTQYSAQIVFFDQNCYTCIVSFPDDSLEIKNLLGESPGNIYQIVNLYKGDFKIGQKLKVEVRKAKNNELNACISMYQSFNYMNLYALNYENYADLKFNDTLVLAYKNCLFDSVRQTYICLDTVLSDSRCPSGAECVWAGETRARFKIEKFNSNPVFINLKEGVKDTVVAGYKISFIKLLPYPSVGNQPKPEEYQAWIVIKNN